MNKAYKPGIHFIVFIIFSGIYFKLIDKYVVNDDLLIVVSGAFFITTGIWGNIAKITMLNVPWGPRSYRIINYILVVLGCIALIAGLFKYFL